MNCALSRRRLIVAGAGVLTWPLAGCGGGALAYAPFLQFAFQGVLQRRIVNVSFSPATTTATSGTFDDTSQINVNDPTGVLGFIGSSFTGSFDGRDMTLRLQTPASPLAPSYGGRFTDDATVLLTPDDRSFEAFSVRRNENDSFLPTLTGDWAGEDAQGRPWSMRLDTVPAFGDANATVLLEGSEVFAGAAGAVQGFASVRYIELNVTRNGAATRLTGVLRPDPVRRSDFNAAAEVTGTIAFDGGGSLRPAA